MATFRAPTVLRSLLQGRRHVPTRVVVPAPGSQRRWAQVHDVRFLATTQASRSVTEKYRAKLEGKARDEGLQNIDELKAAAREVVRPLMGSGLELEVEFQGAAAAAQESAMLNRRSILAGAGAGPGGGGGGGGTVVGASLTNYLTCVRVYDRDLPWDVDVD